MKISVITVCRNSARTVAATMESFLQQTHPDKELIVVDGASTDDTLSVVRSFESAHTRIISEPDEGLYDAMNKGLAVYAGDAVGFLNADDRFRDTGTLARIAAGLAEVDIVYGNLDFVSNNETVVRRWRGVPFRRGSFAEGWMPAHPTFYVRRAVVDAVGAFDTRYRISADYDFMLRAMELHDFSSAFLEDVLVEMAYGGKSTRGVWPVLRGNLEAHQSRRKWLETGFFDKTFVVKPLGKISQFFVQ